MITELAEMGVADHVLESISGHLSRRMLEHYSHIRIDAKRQALDALDAARRSTAHNGDGNGDGANETEIQTVVEVGDDLTSQSRHSLVLRGSPPAGKLLIPSNGEMSEWLKEHAWKACVGETLPWVRIPLSPPSQFIENAQCFQRFLEDHKSLCQDWFRPAIRAGFS